MFKTSDELKDFIVWAKSERVQKLTVDGVTVEFSPLAFIGEFEELTEAKTPTNENITVVGANVPDPAMGSDATDDDLFWSSR